jgi:endoglucanase
MKADRSHVLSFLAGLTALSGALVLSPASAGEAGDTEATPELGVYDPAGRFSGASGVAVEHVFMPWRDVDLASLAAAEDYATRRGRKLLVTTEPWSWAGTGVKDAQALGTDMVAGRYDREIGRMCDALGALKAPVSVRWGHEMEKRPEQALAQSYSPASEEYLRCREEPGSTIRRGECSDPASSGNFTWSGWPPERYVRAYPHFVALCRKHAPKASFIWSPRGDDDLVKYYPGDEFVDEIGLSLFGLQAYDRAKFGRDRGFRDALREKYDRVRQYRKPVVVAELGFTGDSGYRATWAKEIRDARSEFPELKSVIYFNDVETYPWPEAFGRPDWRLEPTDLGLK